MQASLEAEAKGKAEALRMKKKLESDINELEIALDHANKANAEAQKNLKRYQNNLKDLQAALEEEIRARDEAREQLGMSERRCNALHGELEESRTLLEQADRGRRQAEGELSEAHDQLNEVSANNASLSMAKRKLEGEMQTLQVRSSYSNLPFPSLPMILFLVGPASLSSSDFTQILTSNCSRCQTRESQTMSSNSQLFKSKAIVSIVKCGSVRLIRQINLFLVGLSNSQ